MGEIHMGQLLERAIKRKGLNISEIAVALNVSRRTLYNWFRLEVIDKSIMERISSATRHDFSSGQSQASIISPETDGSLTIKDEVYWKNKYIDLLERYSDLISGKTK
jgi:transcriptional regulator with XRE-family HTH domain